MRDERGVHDGSARGCSARRSRPERGRARGDAGVPRGDAGAGSPLVRAAPAEGLRLRLDIRIDDRGSGKGGAGLIVPTPSWRPCRSSERCEPLEKILGTPFPGRVIRHGASVVIASAPDLKPGHRVQTDRPGGRPLYHFPQHAHRPDPQNQPGAELLVRVLPAEDPRGRGEPVRDRRDAARPRADLRVGHLRRGRRHARAHGRHREAHQERARHRGDGALHLRRPHPRGAARRARRDARRRHREHHRAARRPAEGRDRVQAGPRRALLRVRAGGADLGVLRLLHRRRLLPGDPPRRVRRRHGPREPATTRSAPARAS